jgi:hypothetical protein
MSKPKLNDAQKARVVELVEQKIPQTTVAQFFSVSPRTITRVLEENGMIHTRRTLSDQEKDSEELRRRYVGTRPSTSGHLRQCTMLKRR